MPEPSLFTKEKGSIFSAKAVSYTHLDSLNLWVDKTAGEQGLNLELLNAEKEKLK